MRFIALLSVALACPLILSAQTNDVQIRPLSLDECIYIALQHNLEVQIRRLDPEVAQYSLKASYGAYDPVLNMAGEHNFSSSPGGRDNQGREYGGTETDANSFSFGMGGLLPWGTRYQVGGRGSDRYGTAPTQDGRLRFSSSDLSGGLFEFGQPLLRGLLIDQPRLQILLNKKNLKISELDLRQQVLRTVTAVELAYYDLIFGQENIAVQQKALELADRLLSENRKRVEVGALAPLDEKQAESQAAASRADLLDAREGERRLQRLLKSLLSDDYYQWRNVVIKPREALTALPEKFDLQQSWRLGLTLRPDFLQQTLALEQQGYRIRYARDQLLPSIELVGGANLTASSTRSLNDAFYQIRDAANPAWSVGGQFSYPLGNRAAKNNYLSAKVAREQLELRLRQLQQQILIEIEDAIGRAQTSYQQVQARREARIYAESALEAEQKKLENGKSTSFEVLRLQRDLTTARSLEIRELANYNNLLAQVAQAEGTTLERRRVSIEAN